MSQDASKFGSKELETLGAFREARLKAADEKAHALARKNKKLRKSAQSREKEPVDDEITPIPKPRGKFSIQNAMGLEDNRKLYTKLQMRHFPTNEHSAGIRAAAIEGKVNFEAKWSEQEYGVICKVIRVVDARHPYLTTRRFPRSWATSAILQRYLNNARSYKSGKATPDSGVNRRRVKLTKIGRAEADAAHRKSPSPSSSNDETLRVALMELAQRLLDFLSTPRAVVAKCRLKQRASTATNRPSQFQAISLNIDANQT
ncbi:hypothetical protein C8J57DRAFT_1529011 [Mycena rebaudengoi]|nr:hypothetical protein C8J57DRAFT_1529011 [Mycena rebaudengoi]